MKYLHHQSLNVEIFLGTTFYPVLHCSLGFAKLQLLHSLTMMMMVMMVMIIMIMIMMMIILIMIMMIIIMIMTIMACVLRNICIINSVTPTFKFKLF